MILPNIRASFGRAEVGAVLTLLSQGEPEARARQAERLRGEGFDALLDDPRTLNALLAGTGAGAGAVPPRLVSYVLVRHALLECGIDDRVMADYLAALLVAFGRRDRALRIDDAGAERFEYLVDLVAAIDTAQGRRAFLLQAHLGDYALWISGLFPDRVAARAQRRGGPDLAYYQRLGATGYRMAAHASDASRFGLDTLYRSCAETFPTLRISLNRISDRFLFPRRGDPVARLLRQVGDELEMRERRS